MAAGLSRKQIRDILKALELDQSRATIKKLAKRHGVSPNFIENIPRGSYVTIYSKRKGK